MGTPRAIDTCTISHSTQGERRKRSMISTVDSIPMVLDTTQPSDRRKSGNAVDEAAYAAARTPEEDAVEGRKAG